MTISGKYPDSFNAQIGAMRANIFSQPNKVDSTDGTIIYCGYAYIDSATLSADPRYLVKKMIITGEVIVNYFAYGDWDDRLTLTYVGE